MEPYDIHKDLEVMIDCVNSNYGFTGNPYEDLAKVLVDVTKHIKYLEEKTDDLEREVRDLQRDVLNLEMEDN